MKTTVQILEVSQAEDGRKLLSFLQTRVGQNIPKGLFMRLVRTGQVRVDGKRCKPFDRVTVGQLVRIPPLSIEQKDSRQNGGELAIVFENEQMILLNKPAGLPVHPGTGWKDSLHTRLAVRFASSHFVPVPVHRLDKDTSGLLLCAKTHAFLRGMHACWPSVTKAYLCWVQGAWTHAGWKTIKTDMEKLPTSHGERVRVGSGKPAVTHVQAVSYVFSHTLLLVVLGSGRTHQIRVHLAENGFPIVGDGKYGIVGSRLLLHATALFWSGHRHAVLPDWPATHHVDPSVSDRVYSLLETAPAKEKRHD